MMGHSRKVLLAFGILSAILAGCSSEADEPIAPTSPAADTRPREEVTFSSPRAVSRYTDTDFEDGDRITVWTKEKNSTTFPYIGDSKLYRYATSSNGFLPVSTPLTKPQGATMQYIASAGYYDFHGRGVFGLYSGPRDYLFAISESTYSNVELTFIHLNAKVEAQIILPYGVEYEKVSVEMILVDDCTIDLFDDDCTLSFDPGPDTWMTLTKDSSGLYSIYAVPCNDYDSGDTVFKVTRKTLDGSTFVTNFSTNKDLSLEMNYRYRFTLDCRGGSASPLSRAGEEEATMTCEKLPF